MFNKQRIRRTFECSFCGKNQDQVQRLIAGPGGVYVCGECIDLFSVQNAPERVEHGTTTNTKETRQGLACSFCGKKEKQVRRLVIGPHQVTICSECIDLCREIIEDVNTGRQ